MINTYEGLIIQQIALSLSLDLSSLRWFSVIPLLPNNDCTLFAMFDVVPDNGLVFKMNDKSTLFSKTYGELLEAQKESFTVDVAKKNYANQKYWINCNGNQVPMYVPSYEEVFEAVKSGAAFDFTFDSSNYNFAEGTFFPSYPSFVINQPFLYFNESAKQERFVFTLHFDELAFIPVQYSNWFSNAAFVSAYKNKDNWVTGTSNVTWDQLFGRNGILNFVTNGLLVASGMRMEIQIFGEYTENTISILKDNQLTSVWPFYLDPENTNQDFVLNQDGSIRVTVTTLESGILMLGMQASSVQKLIG